MVIPYPPYPYFPYPSPTYLTLLSPINTRARSPGILVSSPLPVTGQRFSAWKCTIPHWCSGGRFTPHSSPTPIPPLTLQWGGGGGGTPIGRFGTGSSGQQSAAPPNDVDYPTHTGCGALRPNFPLWRAAPTEPSPHRTSQTSWYPPPTGPTGKRTGSISSTPYLGYETKWVSFCNQRTASFQVTWRYTYFKGPGHTLVTLSLVLPGQNWWIDGSAFTPPPSWTFWCWGVVPPISTRVWTYYTTRTGGGGPFPHRG